MVTHKSDHVKKADERDAERDKNDDLKVQDAPNREAAKKAQAKPKRESLNPVHPGEIVKIATTAENLSAGDVALRLGMGEEQAAEFLDCRVPVTAEIARKAQESWNIPADILVRLQQDFDALT